MKKNGFVQINSDSNIDFFERWVEEGRVAMKPANSLQVLVITPPRKTAKPIKQGRKFKAEIQPSMLAGVATVCKSNENDCTLIYAILPLVILKAEKFVTPTDVSLLNVENSKMTNYFHKSRKSKM